MGSSSAVWSAAHRRLGTAAAAAAWQTQARDELWCGKAWRFVWVNIRTYHVRRWRDAATLFRVSVLLKIQKWFSSDYFNCLHLFSDYYFCPAFFFFFLNIFSQKFLSIKSWHKCHDWLVYVFLTFIFSLANGKKVCVFSAFQNFQFIQFFVF